MKNQKRGNKVGKKPGWLDDPLNVGKVTRSFYGFCVAILLVDVIYSLGWHKHAALQEDSWLYSFETFPAFYGVFGFVVCAGMVLLARFLRSYNGKKILMREEDYWDK